jgi:RimJ/RimL family protein N-acetyltransferase
VADDAHELADAVGVPLGEDVEQIGDVVRETEAYRRMIGVPTEWSGYLAIDRAERAVVGTCSFKGAPDEDGAVEIAYFTFPRFERRGYATAMATALAERAAADPAVRIVRAHTLPERNTSARLLERLGFAHLGEVEDPEDGPVWRWERPARAKSVW